MSQVISDYRILSRGRCFSINIQLPSDEDGTSWCMAKGSVSYSDPLVKEWALQQIPLYGNERWKSFSSPWLLSLDSMGVCDGLSPFHALLCTTLYFSAPLFFSSSSSTQFDLDKQAGENKPDQWNKKVSPWLVGLYCFWHLRAKTLPKSQPREVGSQSVRFNWCP